MDLKTLEVLVKGLATYIPGYQRLLDKFGFSCPGGTSVRNTAILSGWRTSGWPGKTACSLNRL